MFFELLQISQRSESKLVLKWYEFRLQCVSKTIFFYSDVQQPWTEVLSLVKKCASQDTDILNGIDTSKYNR